MCVCVCICICVYVLCVSGYPWRLDDGVRSLGLQAVVNCLVWVSGNKPGSFGGEHEVLEEKDYFCF